MIDMVASTKIGEKLSSQYSEAFIAPELMSELNSRRIDGRPTDYEPEQIAHASFDTWSFGIVMYELCSGLEVPSMPLT